MDLPALRQLKNSVIGNTWKKVQLAADTNTLTALILLLHPANSPDTVHEAAVILASIATVGNLTLRPIITNNAPARLLHLIHPLVHTQQHPSVHRQLTALLRALRNVLVATADMVWGQVWGVGAEKKVVGTGLVGENVLRETPADRSRDKYWRNDAIAALTVVFEPGNLSILLSLLSSSNHQVVLPVYQLFSRLVALPSNLQALVSWISPEQPTASPLQSSEADLNPWSTFFILSHLLINIIEPDNELFDRHSRPKLMEAYLDLLGAIAKGDSGICGEIRQWLPPYKGDKVNAIDDRQLEVVVPHILETAKSTHRAVRLAAIGWRIPHEDITEQILNDLMRLLQTDDQEERVKLNFILAALVSDEPVLQRSACEHKIPHQLLEKLCSLPELESTLSPDLYARSLESYLLALASLAMAYNRTRSVIADYPELDGSSPSCPIVLTPLRILRASLTHESYGVRAAACQLARSLSRAVSVMRTGMVDEGVGNEVVNLLKRELEIKSSEGMDDVLGDAAWTVEVAATATICNLIADFSPFRPVILSDNTLPIIVHLTHSSYTPLALNALWSIKNLLFHADPPTKSSFMSIFTYSWLRQIISSSMPEDIQEQGLEVVQNLLAEESGAEVTRMVERLGGEDVDGKRGGIEGFLDFLVDLLSDKGAAMFSEVRLSAMYVLVNLSLGNEKLRTALTARVELLEVLSEALNVPRDPLKIPAILTYHNLLESSAKTHRPRQNILDILEPYLLKPRLKKLSEESRNLDVVQKSIKLLDVLERERTTKTVTAPSSR
uniref:BSP2 n=1 Tax=Cryptococcus deneoformans TaxID=40410 RepID=Q5NKK9_9TREE|nr:BSP2 [Cryptococcus neoformans var. neoformans]